MPKSEGGAIDPALVRLVDALRAEGPAPDAIEQWARRFDAMPAPPPGRLRLVRGRWIALGVVAATLGLGLPFAARLLRAPTPTQEPRRVMTPPSAAPMSDAPVHRNDVVDRRAGERGSGASSADSPSHSGEQFPAEPVSRRSPRIRDASLRSTGERTIAPGALPMAAQTPSAPSPPAPGPDAVPSEVELIRAARAAMARDLHEAARLLTRHRELYPRGALREEREALGVELSLRREGAQAARRRLAVFEREFPGSAHRLRLRQLLGLPM
ncbi:MAG: hypothetical protein RMK74_04135 [Myxococcales bacterium]|nr:hypothetical protein [Myxococcales bacterium]